MEKIRIRDKHPGFATLLKILMVIMKILNRINRYATNFCTENESVIVRR
jgi:hypothetical protein